MNRRVNNLPRYVKYDNAGNILCFGYTSKKRCNQEKADGIKIMEVNSLSRKMDLTHKVKDPKSDNPKLTIKGE